MIGRLALAVLLLAAFGRTAAAADPAALLAATPPEVVPLDGGSLRVWRLPDRGAARPALEVVVVTIPGGAASWSLVALDRVAPRPALLAQADCPGALVLTSGGFFLAEGGAFRPMGLAVGDGTELSPFAPRRYGGVLQRRGGESLIVPIASFAPGSPADQALQSSPIVVRDGRNDMRRDDGESANRLAIGLDRAGGLVAVGAFRKGGGAVSLHGFAELILALDSAGIAVTDALALDGGSSAQLLVPALGRTWGSPLPGYMPNALCLAAP